MLLHVTGYRRQLVVTGRRLSYAQGFSMVGCQVVEVIVRPRRLHLARGVASRSQEDLPMRFVLGTGEGPGQGFPERHWLDRR